MREEYAKASQTFEESIERIRPVAASLIAKMRNIGDPPDEVSIDFGLNMSAKAGGFHRGNGGGKTPISKSL